MEKIYKIPKSIIQQSDKKEKLFDLIMDSIKSYLKEIIEKIILEERAIFCEEEKDVGNGFYTRDLKTPIGEIEDIKVARTREKNFKSVLFEPYSRTAFMIEDLITAMYQEGCSTRDITRILGRIFEIRYSPTETCQKFCV
jgi:transposase-like protein